MNMHRRKFVQMMENVFDGLVKLSYSKGVEYTGTGDDNVHANFDRLSVKLRLHPMKVLMVYLTKHLDSIDTYVSGIDSGAHQVLSEPIEGRIDDAILYLMLLRAMVRREGDNDRSGYLPPIATPSEMGALVGPSGVDAPLENRTESAPDFRGYIGSPEQREDERKKNETHARAAEKIKMAVDSTTTEQPSWRRPGSYGPGPSARAVTHPLEAWDKEHPPKS